MKDSRFWKMDREGHLLCDAHEDNIEKKYFPIIEDFRFFLQNDFSAVTHSAYLTGSIARGLAKESSDIDFFLIYQKEVKDFDEKEKEILRFTKDLKNRYKEMVSDVQIDSYQYEDVFLPAPFFSTPQFVIKCSSVPLWGEKNLKEKIPLFQIKPYLPNEEIAQMRSDIEEALIEIRKDSSPENVRYWCRRISKNIIRTCFSLVMLNVAKFTRDIDLSAFCFQQYYPMHKKSIKKAEFYVKAPTDNDKELHDFLLGFGSWVIKECDSWLSFYNPQKLIAMPLH